MEKLSVDPALIRRVMRATGTRTVPAAVRAALIRTAELAELYEVERFPRPEKVRELKRARRGKRHVLRRRGDLRRLTGV